MDNYRSYCSGPFKWIGFLFCSCIILGSCQSSDYWKFQENNYCSNSPSCQLSYRPEKAYNQIALHFRRNAEGLILFVDNYHVPASTLPGQPNKAKLIVTWKDGTKEMVIADRMEGGQRLVVPSATRESIISALNREENFAITVGFCTCDIEAKGFSKYHNILIGF